MSAFALRSRSLLMFGVAGFSLVAASVQAAQINKCVLPSGVVEYTSEPCSRGAKLVDQLGQPSPKPSNLREATEMREAAERDAERARLEVMRLERDKATADAARERERAERAEARAQEDARARAAEQERMAALAQERAAIREQQHAEAMELERRRVEAMEEIARSRAEQRTIFIPVAPPPPPPPPSRHWPHGRDDRNIDPPVNGPRLR